ncbi:MAG: IclR family transcriptional regulator [Chloroflexi bacterium]|nr:IclR family transcriptional regulator [Chloroflexota bacterium]
MKRPGKQGDAVSGDGDGERQFSIQSVGRAIDLLGCFRLNEPELGVSELSRRLGLHKSTVCRLLQSLEVADFVRQDPVSGKYSLGFGPVQLAGIVLARLPIREVAHPYLQRLAQATEETVNLGVVNRAEVVNIVQIPSPRPIRFIGWLGRTNPLHCTSGGKVALAYLPPDELRAFLEKPLTRYTERTITSPAELLREIAVVRAQGYGVARDEFEEDLSAISAPIFDYAGNLAALVGISGPSYRMSADRIDAFARLLTEASQEISARLGYSPTTVPRATVTVPAPN